jgi:hypothetical protein
MKTIIALTILCVSMGSVFGSRTTLEATADANYPTYDERFAHNTLNKCWDQIVGPNGDEIEPNADKETITSTLKSCLTMGGLRFSKATASELDTTVGDVADAKKELISTISARAKALLSLDEGVVGSEGEVADGFDASHLSKLASPLNADDDIVKRGGQRADEAATTAGAATLLIKILSHASGDSLNTKSAAVKAGQTSVLLAAADLRAAQNALNVKWCGGTGFNSLDACCNGGVSDDSMGTRNAACGEGIRRTIFNNYAEVDNAAGDEDKQAQDIVAADCYLDDDCFGTDVSCQGEVVVWYDATEEDWNINYESNGGSTVGSCRQAVTVQVGDGSCPANHNQGTLDDLDEIAGQLLDIADYSVYADSKLSVKGNASFTASSNLCIPDNTYMGRVAAFTESQTYTAGGIAAAIAAQATSECNATTKALNNADINVKIEGWADAMAVIVGSTATVTVDFTSADHTAILFDASKLIDDVLAGMDDVSSTDDAANEQLAFARATVVEVVNDVHKSALEAYTAKCTALTGGAASTGLEGDLESARVALKNAYDTTITAYNDVTSNEDCTPAGQDDGVQSVFSLGGSLTLDGEACSAATVADIVDQFKDAIVAVDGYAAKADLYKTAYCNCKNDVNEDCAIPDSGALEQTAFKYLNDLNSDLTPRFTTKAALALADKADADC